MTRDTRTAAERAAATGLVAKTIRLPPAVWRVLDEMALDEGQSRSAMIESFILSEQQQLNEISAKQDARRIRNEKRIGVRHK